MCILCVKTHIRPERRPNFPKPHHRSHAFPTCQAAVTVTTVVSVAVSVMVTTVVAVVLTVTVALSIMLVDSVSVILPPPLAMLNPASFPRQKRCLVGEDKYQRLAL